MKRESDSNFSKRAIDLRERFSSAIIVRALIVFVLSMLLYGFTDIYPITVIAGFIGILSGAIIILFVIIYLIFFFLEKMKYSKAQRIIKSNNLKEAPKIKKASKKTAIKKKTAVKKAIKKTPIKKKVVKKKIAKKK